MALTTGNNTLRSLLCLSSISNVSHITTPPKTAPVLNITACRTSVGTTGTLMKEKPASLYCTSPSFRASAAVMFPRLSSGQVYTLGWVQAVEAMELLCHYPSGVSSWEIPELSNGPVSDACGHQYPWYGIDLQRVTVKGPLLAQTVKVRMEDFFCSSFNWSAAISGWTRPFKRHTLQRVVHKQSFLTWLVLKDEFSGEFQALKGYRWKIEKDIEVDCSRRLGDRARLVQEEGLGQPESLSDLSIPESALRALTLPRS